MGVSYVVDADHISRTRFLGKGGFGAVYAGTMENRAGQSVPIAMKMLQPVKPGEDADPIIHLSPNMNSCKCVTGKLTVFLI